MSGGSAMMSVRLTATEQGSLLAAATAAPSIHNTQPWRFAFGDGIVELFADESRRLNAVDPDGRNLTISCGAALLNLRIAAEQLGYAVQTELLPAGDSDLLARAQLSPTAKRNGMSGALFDAIALRHTNRWPFEERTVPTAVLQSLIDAAGQEGARLHPVTDAAERHRLVGLLHVGELERDLDPALAQEAAAWTGVSADRADGVPGYALGPLPDNSSAAVRDLRRGAPMADRQRAHFESAPVLAVLSTSRDDRVAWLVAGMALQRVLLAATLEGLATSFVNQAIERHDLRWLVRDPSDPPGHPQMVIRIGYGSPGLPTPRRPLDEVTGTPPRG